MRNIYYFSQAISSFSLITGEWVTKIFFLFNIAMYKYYLYLTHI